MPHLPLHAAGNIMVDVTGADEHQGQQRAGGHGDHEPEHGLHTKLPAKQSREKRGGEIAGMVESLVPPELVGQTVLSHEPEGERRQRRPDGRAGEARDDLGSGRDGQRRHGQKGERGDNDGDGAGGDQCALRPRRIRQSAQRCRRQHAGEPAHRHDQTDLVGRPALADEEDAEERPQPVPHIGEKEIDAAERPD